MTEFEKDVIEAVQDWYEAIRAHKYGGHARHVNRAETAMTKSFEALCNENDGRWERP